MLKRELAKLHTGEDVIAFFAKNGSNSSVKFVYCKRREHVEVTDFRPYDLEVITELMEGPDSDRLSQPSVDSQPGLQKPDEEVVASPEMFASAPNALAFDETKLIDLPLAEQRRRGNELLSMLSETGFGFS
eukprot:g12452.t1